MKKNNVFLRITTLLVIVAGVLFLFKTTVYAMSVGTLLYRTSAKGWLYGLGGKQDLVEVDYASSTLPKLRINCGHTGIYVGKIDGKDMVLEAVNNGVQLIPAQYFVNTKEGEKFIGAKFPVSDKILKIEEKEFEKRIQKIANFFKENKMGYDYEFKDQKGPRDKQWTCVGLTEKIYESLGFDLRGEFDESKFVYNTPNYFIDITPDGFNNEDIANPYNQDVFSETFEFSKITKRSFEVNDYALGRIENGNRYFFLPYTQYLQGSLKDVEVDINLESSFDVDEIRGKTPGSIYVAYLDNASGGKINGTKEKTKEIGTQIASGAKSAASTVALALKSAAATTAKVGKNIWDFIPDLLQGAGQASLEANVLVKGDGSSGIPEAVKTQNKADVSLAKAAVELEKKIEPAVVLNSSTTQKTIKPSSVKNNKKSTTTKKPVIKEVKKTTEKKGEEIKIVPAEPLLPEKKVVQDIKPVVDLEVKKIVEEPKTATTSTPLLIHYPFRSGGQSQTPAQEEESLNDSTSTEEEIVPIPSFKSFALADQDSLSEAWTNEILVKVLTEIENVSAVEKFSLNESGLIPSETDWLSEPVVDYSLSAGDGLKKVYSWISYKKGVASTSAEIVLDTKLSTSSLANLAENYDESGFMVSWSGYDGLGLGVDFYNVQYSFADEWLPWLSKTASTSDFFDLPMVDGSKLSFRVQSLDKAGNVGAWSEPVATTISKSRHLLISEFSTRGNDGAYDEFVELYNPGNQDISLAGWQLQSRSAATSSNWVNRSGDGLPDSNILAHGYFLLAASGYSGTVSPDYRHSANWSLSDAGGGLRIIDDNDQEVDKIYYGSLATINTSLTGFGENDNYAAERKASRSSTAQSLRGEERYSGNSFDNDSSDDFVLKTDSSPQNSASLLEPGDYPSLSPSAIADLGVSLIMTDSLILSWSSPENANFDSGAKYDIRYVLKTSDCNIDLLWDSALVVSNSLVPANIGGAQSFTVKDLTPNKRYCFAIKTFNAYNWSEISNLAEAKTLAAPKPELVDLEYAPDNNPVGVHNYYNLNYAYFAGQSFIPRQNNISSISLFGKRNGSFTLRLCSGDFDLSQSAQANFNCDLAGQTLLGEASFANDTFPPCTGNPSSPNPCFSSLLFTKLSFASPIPVEPNKKHFFILSGGGGVTLVGTRTDRWPTQNYPDGHLYLSDNSSLDFDVIFRINYLSD